jgi:hypothetical protein
MAPSPPNHALSKSGPKNSEPEESEPIDEASIPRKKGRPANPGAPGHGRSRQREAAKRKRINWRSSEVQDYFVGEGLLAFLGDVVAGRYVLCQEPRHKVEWRRPPLEMRTRVALDILKRCMPESVIAEIDQRIEHTGDDPASDPRQLGRAILAVLQNGLHDTADVIEIPAGYRSDSGSPRDVTPPGTELADGAGSGVNSPTATLPAAVEPSDNYVRAGNGFVGPDNGMGWAIFDSFGKPFEASLPSRSAAISRAEFLSRKGDLR